MEKRKDMPLCTCNFHEETVDRNMMASLTNFDKFGDGGWFHKTCFNFSTKMLKEEISQMPAGWPHVKFWLQALNF